MGALLGVAPDKRAVCTANSIKILSGQKPMRINSRGEPTVAQKKAANYGYVFPTCSLVELLLLELYGVIPSGWTSKASDANYRALMNEWYYAKPRGGNYNEWFRNLDFEGYDHDITADALVNTNIPSSWVLGQNSTFYASLFQQQPASMANFWQDSSHTKPMALTGAANHALGIAVASSELKQERLQTSDASARCGQWCKYQRFASPLMNMDYSIASADWLFLNTAGTYRIVPFLIGKSTTIGAYNNNGSTMLAESDCIPLPTPVITCTVSERPAPSVQFTINGSPTLSIRLVSWQVAYSPAIHGYSYTAGVYLYRGTTQVSTVKTQTYTLNGTQSGNFYYANHTMTIPVTPVGSGEKLVLKISCGGTYNDQKDIID